MESTHGDWRDDAACTKADPELFFPHGETGKVNIDQIRKAKEFCVSCLAINQCLDYALSTNQDSGIWGGETEGARKKFKRRAARLRRGW